MWMSWYMYVMLLIKLLAVLYGIYNWNRLNTFLKLVAIHSVTTFTTELTGMIMLMLHYTQNAIVFNISLPIELLVLCASCLTLFRSLEVKTAAVGLILCSYVYWSFLVLTSGINNYFNWYRVVSSIIIVLVFTTALLKSSVFNNDNVFKQPVFLVSSGKIIYYAVTIPLFGLYTYMVENSIGAIRQLFYISHVTDFIQYSAVIVAIYLYIGKHQKESSIT